MKHISARVAAENYPRKDNMPRPEKPIDWKLVDLMLEAHCTGTEIASKFDMHPNTFYDRVVQEYKMSFTEYSVSKNESGKANLRFSIYTRALKGNDKLTLHLTKHMLNQWDKFDKSEISQESIQQMLLIMQQLTNMQVKPQIDLNNAESSNNPET